jgi:hypothetical protein
VSAKHEKPQGVRAERAERLAAALKANLRRRKAQARARQAAGDEAPAADHSSEAAPNGRNDR